MAPPPPLPATLQPPPEQVAEWAVPVPSDAHRSLPTPFLTKTYQLVDDPAIDDIISWNEDGSTFVVWRPAEFARDLLPKHFKHNNFSSFVRQLNTYGFRKIVPDRWEFANDCFRRGEKQLLCDIHRRKVQPVPAVVTAIPVGVPPNRVALASPNNSGDEQVLSPNSSSGAAPSSSGRRSSGTSTDIMEENNRLRKENERLNQELSQMKSLCNNILLLMSKYTGQHPQQNQLEDARAGRSGCAQAAGNPPPPSSSLELMPLTRCSDDSDPSCSRQDDGVKTEEQSRSPSPRLFGVPIRQKRTRVPEDEDAAADGKPQHRRAVEIKTEPAGPTAAAVDSPPDRDHYRWRPCGTCRPNERVCN